MVYTSSTEKAIPTVGTSDPLQQKSLIVTPEEKLFLKDTLNHPKRIYMRNHMLTHTAEKLCGKRSTTKVTLKNHHTSKKQYRCTLCEYTCVFKRNLKNHMLSHTVEKPFKCTFCDYRCGEATVLNRHISSRHTGDKLLKCSQCSYRCNYIGSMKGHMLKHTGEKPYKCDYCEYRSVYKSNLTTHLLKHTGEKPFKCDFCGYRYTRYGYLRFHVVSKHPGEVLLESDFTTPSPNRQARETEEDEPLKCYDCGYQFKAVRNLMRHIEKSHAKKTIA